MRFASLGSGSHGNATLIEGGGARVLVDCGFPAKEITGRLAEVGLHPDDLDAILVTHEHQDHIQGVGPLARRFGLPVWITHGTYRSNRLGEVANLELIHSHQSAFSIGALTIQPYPVPHDSREPVQFCFSEGDMKLGLLTDVGQLTPHIMATLSGCDALILEFNHDVDMLANGPYPPSLQRRVGGRLGHLSNHQAVNLLEQIDSKRLVHLVAAHLSEKNNHPEQVQGAVLSAVPELERCLHLTQQDAFSGWFEVSA